MSGVHVDALTNGALVRADERHVAALRLLTSALGRAHDELVVVGAPSVLGRDDLFAWVARAARWADRPPAAVRVILLGGAPDPAAVERGVRDVARELGRPVTGALGPVLVASDGTCVASTAPEPGWVRAEPGRPIRYDPPWSPEPPWSVPVPAPAGLPPAVVVRPVPAGLWLRPADGSSTRSGVVPTLPRRGSTMGLFVGGGGHPLAAADIDRAVEVCGLARPTRLTVLPGALEPGHPLPLRLDVEFAVPALGPDGWDLLGVESSGRLGAGPRPRARPRAADPGQSTLRVPSPARTELPGTRTAAGWSFVPGVEPLAGRAIVGPVVEVGLRRGALLVAGEAVPPDRLADLITRAVQPTGAPVVLVVRGPAKPPPSRGLAALADALGGTVIVAHGSVSLTAEGVLLAAQGLWQWRPGGRRRREPTGLGPVLPPVTRAVAGPSPPVRPVDDGPFAQRPTHGAVGLVVAPRSCDAADRAELARAVVTVDERYAGPLRASLERPGSDGESAARLIAGLTALRAYCDGERDRVNRLLRGQPADGPDRLALIAGCARAGLRHLPVVVGPVFATSTTTAPLPYHPGLELVEPGFVDATLAPAAPGSITYVVWSTTARRVGETVHSGPTLAVFEPGSRFRVVAVDEAAPVASVLLADVTTGRPADDVLDRLRAAADRRPGAPVRPIAPVGFSDHGQPYRM